MRLLIEILRSSVLAATPVLLAGLGGVFTYHADVFNVAMEGMMLIGAFMAVVGSYLGGSWVSGLVFGLIGGCIAGLTFAFFAVYLGTGQFVTGTAINMLALGGTTFALRRLFNVKGAFISPRIEGIPIWRIPLIDRIPIARDIISGYPFIVYISVVLVLLADYVLFRTRYGLRLRAAGEDARALDSLGVNARGLKTSSILISGLLCSLAGVFLSLAYVTLFAEGMTNGRGWIALAVIFITQGRPWGLLLMSLIFGFFDGLGLSLQGTAIPAQFTQMTPYIATIVALYMYSREKTVSSKE